MVICRTPNRRRGRFFRCRCIRNCPIRKSLASWTRCVALTRARNERSSPANSLRRRTCLIRGIRIRPAFSARTRGTRWSMKSAHFGYPIRFQQCQCGLQKQTPMPNQAFFDWFFNSEVFFSSQKTSQKNIWGYHDYFADEPCRLATSRRRYRVLRRWFEERPGSNIMKIGPATGTMLHVLKQHGHQVLGCDVSNRFAQYAMQNYQVPIDIGRFEKQGYAQDNSTSCCCST